MADTVMSALQGVDPKIQQAWDSGLLGALGFTASPEGVLSGPEGYWWAGGGPQVGTSSGMPIDANANPVNPGPTSALMELLRNQLAVADTLGQSAPSDPRVDAFYQSNPGASMVDLMKALPDAGSGTPLGGIGTLHNAAIRNNIEAGGTNDPSVQSPFYVGQDLPSTNNWRLLPPPYNQPGYIMRNGIIISTSSMKTDRGFWAGGNPQGGVSAEHGNVVPYIGFGTGARFGYPGWFAPGYAPQSVGWPGSISPWQPLAGGYTS